MVIAMAKMAMALNPYGGAKATLFADTHNRQLPRIRLEIDCSISKLGHLRGVQSARLSPGVLALPKVVMFVTIYSIGITGRC
jgi:hypothetical protein